MTSRPSSRRTGRLALPLLAVLSVAAIGALAFTRRDAALVAQGTAPDYGKDVAPVLYRNCAGCHRPGGIGPFSVIDADTVKAYAKDIREAVATGYMPPWHAEGPRGVFSNDRRLSDLERQAILQWTDAGAKVGDRRSHPTPPVISSAWEIGQPDAVFTMSDAYTVPASGTVEYQYFEVPTDFSQDKWVQAVEIMPGSREVVHHVLVYARTAEAPAAAPTGAPAAGAAAAPKPPISRDANHKTDDPPRKDPRNAPPMRMGTLIGTTAPGTNVVRFPEGTALRVAKGTSLVFEMHYTTHGHEVHDRTSVGFRFAKGVPSEQVLASSFLNGQFTLPAGAKDVMVPSTLTINEPIKIYGLFPHTHLRGKKWQYVLEKPDGTSEVILDVPRYDFNWQTYYMFATPLEIPAGAKLTSKAWYDNSAGNLHNPDPKVDVRWGDQTWEEMQYTGILYSVNSRRLR